MQNLISVPNEISRTKFEKKLNKYENNERKQIFTELEKMLSKNRCVSVIYAENIYKEGSDGYVKGKRTHLALYCVNLNKNKREILDKFKETAKNCETDIRLYFITECLIISLSDAELLTQSYFSSYINFYTSDVNIINAQSGYYKFPYSKKNEKHIIMQIKTLQDIIFKSGKFRFNMSLRAFYFLKEAVGGTNLHFQLAWKPIEVLAIKWRENNVFWKDIFKSVDDFKTHDYPPISIKLISECHNMQELIQKKLKIKMPKSVNKSTIETAYYVTEICKKVAKNDRQKLYYLLSEPIENFKFVSDVYYIPPSAEQKILSIINRYYTDNLEGYQENHYTLVSDYTMMLLHAKQQFPLTIKTINGLIKRHNELVLKAKLNSVPQIEIPKNSKFNSLILPEKYERITTQERLYSETVMQKHCVFSYANKIIADECAIYSVIYEENRYTIEIIVSQKKYHINQIQGFKNLAAPRAIWDELQQILDEL